MKLLSITITQWKQNLFKKGEYEVGYTMHKTLILEYLVYTERSYIPVAFSFQALKG